MVSDVTAKLRAKKVNMERTFDDHGKRDAHRHGPGLDSSAIETVKQMIAAERARLSVRGAAVRVI